MKKFMDKKKKGQFSFVGNFNHAVNLVSNKVKIINVLLCLHSFPPIIIIKEKEKLSRMTATFSLSPRETETREMQYKANLST